MYQQKATSLPPPASFFLGRGGGVWQGGGGGMWQGGGGGVCSGGVVVDVEVV